MKKSLKDLVAFQKGQAQAKEIFELTQKFPREELYSLTDQIRRSSRAVCANLGEAYRKRMYEAYFISKVSDADMENTETQVWLKFAFDCQYISEEIYTDLTSKSEEIGRLLDYYMKHPEKFRRKPSTDP
jgi:four helix bundle protein